jgi:hypothetical protein
MFRTILSLLAVLPTLLPPGMCVCQLAPPISVAAAKSTDAPKRFHRCSCCRQRTQRPLADSSTRQKTPGHGWNESSPIHDPACPVLHGTPLPRMLSGNASQLVTTVAVRASVPLPLPTAPVESSSDPPPLTPPHLGFRVLLI